MKIGTEVELSLVWYKRWKIFYRVERMQGQSSKVDEREEEQEIATV